MHGISSRRKRFRQHRFPMVHFVNGKPIRVSINGKRSDTTKIGWDKRVRTALNALSSIKLSPCEALVVGNIRKICNAEKSGRPTEKHFIKLGKIAKDHQIRIK